MTKNAIYKRFKNIAIAAGYSVGQIQNATYEVVRKKLGGTYQGKTYEMHLSETIIDNIKELLIRQLQTRADEKEKKTFIEQLKVGFAANFPNAEIERSRDQGKRKITIWIDGQPGEI